MLAWNTAVKDVRMGGQNHVGTAALGCPAGRRPAARSTARRRIPAHIALLFFLFAVPSARAANCLAVHEVAQHIGETKCVTGRVVRVKVGSKAVHFLDFCEDAIACPFTVVIFANDLKDIGDVCGLSGHTLEIRGTLKMYDGRPEIILRRISQIEGAPP